MKEILLLVDVILHVFFPDNNSGPLVKPRIHLKRSKNYYQLFNALFYECAPPSPYHGTLRISSFFSHLVLFDHKLSVNGSIINLEAKFWQVYVGSLF